MSVGDPGSSMHIRLTDDRRAKVHDAVRQLFLDEFDDEISEFRIKRIVEFMAHVLGPPIYNQAVQDVRKFMMEKLGDLEGEVFEPESV